ncbi:MAG: HYR domain-containing protein [Bacteroidetes bacterium]|nr:HYR domain-containing protein [Bacteroidota bacterium]
MKSILQKFKVQLAGAIVAFGLSNQAQAQCLSINCPPSLTVNAQTGTCSAVVSYSAPVVSSTCGLVTQTISYTGAIQQWTVPAGVTTMTIQALGAEGGNSTSSTIPAGLGADIRGTFTVTPGQVLKVLVGQSPTGGNGGGGGTFVTDMSNNPIIIAGGGGGSAGATDSPNKHGQAGTAGGNGAGGGGTGGTAGNGGSIGATFASGAGGGLLTDGAAGWTTTSGGKSFLNGGLAGTGGAVGGFGGGGSGSGYVVGAGGGGYSGGGSGSNSAGQGVGGGGGSYNGGTNQVNTTGVHTGNGVVYITYGTGTYTTTQTAGLTSGSTFPIGTTVQTFSVVDSFSNTTTCSFSVTVVDAQTPTVTCPSNVVQCAAVVSSIAPVSALDNCSSPSITYSLSGATTGTGTANASGTSFNTGVTNVTYMAMDGAGNIGSCTFSVTINVTPTVTAVSSTSLICSGQTATLTANGASTYTWNTGSNNSSIVISPSVTTSYTVSGDSSGCVNSTVITQSVSACTGFETLVANNYNVSVYPNPNNGEFVVNLGTYNSNMTLEVYNVLGEKVVSEKITSETTQVKLNNKANGTYIVKIMQDNQLVYKSSIIKQ